MNDQVGGTGPPGGGEAPHDARQRLEALRGQDLTDEDLTGEQYKGLQPVHLAGCTLSGAKLPYPHEIPKYFMGLAQVKEISADARKIFIGLLAACVYSWLVIGTTRDVDLVLNTATSPLPIIGTAIPIAGFYVVGAALLAAVYCYFHFYLLRLWRTLVTLPVVFPDGIALDDKADPWLLTGLVRTYMPGLAPRALGYLENLLSIFLAWGLVPLTLFLYWVRLLPAHYGISLVWLSFLIAFTAFFGWHTFSLARETLRSKAPQWIEAQRGQQVPDGGHVQALLVRVLGELRQLRPHRVILGLLLPFIILAAFSLSVVVPSPWNTPTTGAILLNYIGIRTHADLREVDLAERPEGWDGKDWSSVRRVDLRGRNLAFADATRAFLANANLRGAKLTGASLEEAELQGADLYDEHREREAQLQGAWLLYGQLQGAFLASAQLQGANLSFAQLQGANLSFAQLQGADLRGAQLQGANLLGAQLQGAVLGDAQLQGAYLRDAELGGADLRGANLKGADLRWAGLGGADLGDAWLQGADLQGAWLWRAVAGRGLAGWELVDLRDSGVDPIADAEVHAFISEAVRGIPEWYTVPVVDRLTTALRTGDRPARPDFPGEWRSHPNVMFTCDGPPRERIEHCDPAPLPLPWGTRTWATERDYDKELAVFLGELACGRDVPDVRTRGLVRRAFETASIRRERDRLWPRLFAERVTGPDCPPAKGLPEDMRRDLEQLAAELKEEFAAAAIPETSSPDPE